VVLPADEDATLPLYPSEETLDEPPSHITAQAPHLTGGMCSNGHGIGLIRNRGKKWTNMKSGSKGRMQGHQLLGSLNRNERWGSSKFAIRPHQ
jgi:hypothetical protein